MKRDLILMVKFDHFMIQFEVKKEKDFMRMICQLYWLQILRLKMQPMRAKSSAPSQENTEQLLPCPFVMTDNEIKGMLVKDLHKLYKLLGLSHIVNKKPMIERLVKA